MVCFCRGFHRICPLAARKRWLVIRFHLRCSSVPPVRRSSIDDGEWILSRKRRSIFKLGALILQWVAGFSVRIPWARLAICFVFIWWYLFVGIKLYVRSICWNYMSSLYVRLCWWMKFDMGSGFDIYMYMWYVSGRIWFLGLYRAWLLKRDNIYIYIYITCLL